MVALGAYLPNLGHEVGVEQLNKRCSSTVL
jgi:hypothetical protein